MSRLLPMLLLLSACGGRHAENQAPQDPAALAEAARARPLPDVLKVSFLLNVQAPRQGVSGTAKGGMILARPAMLRLDLLTPFGTNLGTVAGDGQSLALFAATKNTLYSASDAEVLLRDLTGGAAGFADLCTLLLGGLPFADATVTGVEQDKGHTTWSFSGPEQSQVRLTVEDKRQVTTAVRALNGQGEEVMLMDYTDYGRLNGVWLPDEVELSLPTQEISLSLSLGRWEQLDSAPPVFTLPSPPGVNQVDLAKWLAEQRAP